MIGYRTARDEDWVAVERLLTACDLPIAGARAHLGSFIVAVDGNAVVGCVGAEVYGRDALLRSLAVRADRRGNGVGETLLVRLSAALQARGVTRVVLLTTTAEEFFTRRGFVRVGRTDVPEAVLASEEFRGACPASAVSMMIVLE